MDIDYQQDCFLRKDGTVLSPDVRDSEIARVMPETVSCFFLFDGELLQQYEELLRDESELGATQRGYRANTGRSRAHKRKG
jgi:DNA sulfur modification protein DndD